MEVYALCPPCDDDYYGLSSPIAIVTSIEEAKKLLKERYKKEIIVEEENVWRNEICIYPKEDPSEYSYDPTFFLVKFELNTLNYEAE